MISTQSSVLQSDFLKMDDVLTVVPDLEVALEAEHQYRVTGQMVVETGLAGFTIDFAGGTAGLNGISGCSQSYNAANDAYLGHRFSTPLSQFGSLLDDFTVATFDFTINVTTAGSLIPRFSQGIPREGDVSKLLKYSTITVYDVTT